MADDRKVALERASRAPRLSFQLKTSWSTDNVAASQSPRLHDDTRTFSTSKPIDFVSYKTEKSLSLHSLRDLAAQLASVHGKTPPQKIRLRSNSRSNSTGSTSSRTNKSSTTVKNMNANQETKMDSDTQIFEDVFEEKGSPSLPSISKIIKGRTHSVKKMRRKSSIIPNLPTITESGAKIVVSTSPDSESSLDPAIHVDFTTSGYGNNNSILDEREGVLRKTARKWLLKALDRELKEEQELLDHMKTTFSGWDPIRGVYRKISDSVPLRVGPKVNACELSAKASEIKRRIFLKTTEDHNLYGGSAVNSVPHYFEVTNGYAKAKLYRKKSILGTKLQRRKSHQHLIDNVKNAGCKDDLEEALQRLRNYQHKIVENNFNCRQRNLVKTC